VYSYFFIEKIMVMKYIICALIICLGLSFGYGQGIYIDNKTVFKDGIYMSFEDFVNNEPSMRVDALHVKWIETPFFNKLKFKSCKKYNKGKLRKVDMREIWGICIGGVPYIQYSVSIPYRLEFGNSAEDLNGKSSFSRIRILGNICHFNIEDYFPKRQNSSFANNMFSKEGNGKMIRAQKMLKLSTGKVYAYDEYILGQLIKDDSRLYADFKNDAKREYKLFVYLQEYNKRNPVMNRSVMANNDKE